MQCGEPKLEAKLKEFKVENDLLGKLLTESLSERKALMERLDTLTKSEEAKQQLESELQEMQQRVKETEEHLTRSLECQRDLEGLISDLRSELIRMQPQQASGGEQPPDVAPRVAARSPLRERGAAAAAAGDRLIGLHLHVPRRLQSRRPPGHRLGGRPRNGV